MQATGGRSRGNGDWCSARRADSGRRRRASSARRGMSVIGVHLDRKATLPLAEAVAADVRAAGAQAHFFNVNAADDEKRVQVCDARARADRRQAAARAAALARLRHAASPFVGDDPGQQTTKAQLEMTLDVMAHSLVYWVQDLHARGLLGEGSRVFAMTSSGGTRVMPFYGAVSAAKAALESHVRQLALELGRRGRRRQRDPRRRDRHARRRARFPCAEHALRGGAPAESRRPPDRAGRRRGCDRRPVAARERAGSAGT